MSIYCKKYTVLQVNNKCIIISYLYIVVSQALSENTYLFHALIVLYIINLYIVVSQALRENTYPFLALIVLRDNRMTVVARIEGPVGKIQQYSTVKTALPTACISRPTAHRDQFLSVPTNLLYILIGQGDLSSTHPVAKIFGPKS
jgi:hypothetical protein